MSEAAERYASVQAILAGARGLGVAELDHHLTTHCGDDAAFRSEVLELLAADREAEEDGFADASIQNVRSSLEQLVDGATSSWLPARIGSYEIVRQIGLGGMGIVYEAKQESPRRSVAIKLLHPIHATEERLRRFRREAELLGRLQHRGIAQIYEAGTYDVGRGPQPFIAMELVDGVDIGTHCAREGLDRAGRIELLARVAGAVQYAHDHGVVHRDLKPDNILINERGEPRILDFGIATATDRTTALSTILTEKGQIVGTLAYMAPEQLSESVEELTSRVDVYTLGVIGFELLTGSLPRVVADLSVAQAIERLSRTEATRAGRLDQSLRGDVETILGKALEHDPARRYATASAFAADLRRHVADQPIEARPPTRTYLVRKFAKRNKVLVGGVVATLVVAIAGTIVSTSYAIAASRRADTLERASYLSSISAAGSAVREQDYTTAAVQLDRSPVAHRGWEYDYLRARLVHHVGDWDAPAPLASAPVFDSEGRQMFATMSDGSLGTWDGTTGQLKGARAIRGTITDPRAVLLHGPTSRFAAVASDGDIVIRGVQGAEQRRIEDDPSLAFGRNQHARALAWDPAGRRLLYAVLGAEVKIWDGNSLTLPATKELRGHGTFTRAGDRVALVGGNKLALFNAATGKRICEGEVDDAVTDFAFAPDGETLAVAGYNGNVYLLDGHTLQVKARLNGHRGVVLNVAWNGNGSRLITAARDGTVRIWDVDAPGSAIVYATDMQGDARAVVMPDDEHLLVAGKRIRRFPLGDPAVLRGHRTFVYKLAFSPDGKLLASSGFQERDILVWDVHRAQLRWRLRVPGGPSTPVIRFSSDGRRLVAAAARMIAQWSVDTGGESLVTNIEPDLKHAWARFFEELGRRPFSRGSNWALSSHDNRIARCDADGSVALFDYPHETHPDFRRRLELGQFGREHVSRVLSHAESTSRLDGHIGTVHCAAFSPDGTRIATGGSDTTVRIWDARTCEQLLVLRGHEQYVMSVAFSPDGTLLASASGDTTVRLWDTLPLPERRALAEKR